MAKPMNISRNPLLTGTAIIHAVLLAGCQTPSPAPPDTPSKAVGEAAGAAQTTAFDSGKGYLHKESGVGFLYPAGWEVLGVGPSGVGTALELQKDNGASEVTLFWTDISAAPNDSDIGNKEYESLRPLYGDKITHPKPVRVGKQEMYKIEVNGGPIGESSPDLSGVIYVTRVTRDGRDWKIKLRATVNDKKRLPEIEQLLKNYRF